METLLPLATPPGAALWGRGSSGWAWSRPVFFLLPLGRGAPGVGIKEDPLSPSNSCGKAGSPWTTAGKEELEEEEQVAPRSADCCCCGGAGGMGGSTYCCTDATL